ncbi:hypothetical protein F511_16095 [Dorcoceras hygrometricum]|uniref:Uncharacterized protein n=1 Tax=Dorcoceras hygrometricum TaxID=472368 RepID=A0A2Z7C1C2_9LAMI|nr:hypothetical protein F511_16095 [Dorcoceras hygrometricum]
MHLEQYLQNTSRSPGVTSLHSIAWLHDLEARGQWTEDIQLHSNLLIPRGQSSRLVLLYSYGCIVLRPRFGDTSMQVTHPSSFLLDQLQKFSSSSSPKARPPDLTKKRNRPPIRTRFQEAGHNSSNNVGNSRRGPKHESLTAARTAQLVAKNRTVHRSTPEVDPPPLHEPSSKIQMYQKDAGDIVTSFNNKKCYLGYILIGMLLEQLYKPDMFGTIKARPALHYKVQHSLAPSPTCKYNQLGNM